MVSAWPEAPSVIPAEWPAGPTAGARTKRNGTGVRSIHNRTPVCASLIHVTEGHELDRKWKVAKEMIGRRLSQEEAKRLLAKFV
jgi:hypothetical protein